MTRFALTAIIYCTQNEEIKYLEWWRFCKLASFDDRGPFFKMPDQVSIFQVLRASIALQMNRKVFRISAIQSVSTSPLMRWLRHLKSGMWPPIGMLKRPWDSSQERQNPLQLRCPWLDQVRTPLSGTWVLLCEGSSAWLVPAFFETSKIYQIISIAMSGTHAILDSVPV